MKKLIVTMLAAMMIAMPVVANAAPVNSVNPGTQVPQAPAAPAAAQPAAAQPAAAPASVQPVRMNAQINQIEDVEAFVAGLLASGTNLAIDAQDLIAVIQSINDPNESTMSLEEAIAILTGGKNAYKVYKNGVVDETARVELDDYHFIGAMEELELEGEQQTDANGEPIPASVTIAPQSLADVQKEEVQNYYMMVYELEKGEVAFIEINADDLNTSVNPPELTAITPYGGLLAFVQKVD